MTGSLQQVEPSGFWSEADEAERELAAKPRRNIRETPPEPLLAAVARAVEAEVVPRLVLARRSLSRAPVASAREARLPTSSEVAELAALVVASDGGLASSYVEAIRRSGVSVETLYLELLTPTARRLGELWTADLCGFAEVTIALSRLQQMLRELSPAFLQEVGSRAHGRRVLLVPVPGEQHSFGLFMVAEFFRRAGWDVWTGPAESSAELAGLVRREWFAAVGLSLSCDVRIDALARSIREVRRSSRNPAIGVLVGGPAFLANAELTSLIGADATAVDGRNAVLQAQGLLNLISAQR